MLQQQRCRLTDPPVWDILEETDRYLRKSSMKGSPSNVIRREKVRQGRGPRQPAVKRKAQHGNVGMLKDSTRRDQVVLGTKETKRCESRKGSPNL